MPENGGGLRGPTRQRLTDVEADPEELVWGIVGRALDLADIDHRFLWPYAGLMTWLTPRPLMIFTGGYRPVLLNREFVPSALGAAFRGLLGGAKNPI